jgi:hypothetical protein
MQGYIFEYYKYVRYAKDSLNDMKKIFAYDEARKSFVTYGVFEQLKVNLVDDISRFRDLSILARKWIGNRQSLLFYTIDDEPPYYYKEDVLDGGNDCFGFCDSLTQEYDNHLFLAVTEFPFKSKYRKEEDYEKWLENIRIKMDKTLQKRIKDEKYDVSYMFLGNLGVFGISILWFSNQYTHILDLVNYLRSQIGDTFQSAYTNISKNHLNKQLEDESIIKKIEDIDGKAIVQITLKKHLDEDMKYKSSSLVSNVKHSAGQYDVILEMDAKDVYDKFEMGSTSDKDFDKYAIFDHDTDQYQKEILQMKVTLTQNMKGCDEVCSSEQDAVDEHIDDTHLVESLKSVDKEYKRVRKTLKKTFPCDAGIVDTFDALVCDYRYNVVSAVNENWADDFSYIFLIHIRCIEKICKFFGKGNGDIYHYVGSAMEIMRMLMNNLKQQIFHISESNSLNFEMPKCHLRYTGNEDSIMYCYMGIIKEILETVYQLDGYNMQSEIVPIVTVDAVNIIESFLYNIN